MVPRIRCNKYPRMENITPGWGTELQDRVHGPRLGYIAQEWDAGL